MKRKILGPLCVSVFLGCSASWSGDDPTASATEGPGPCEPGSTTGLEVGMCAPDFALPNAEGSEVKLSSFRGKVALVDISALW